MDEEVRKELNGFRISIESEYRQELNSMRDALIMKIETIELLRVERDTARRLALDVALEANNKRLDAMNEFRNSLTDQAVRMATKAEMTSAVVAIDSRIENNRVVSETRLSSEISPIVAKADVLNNKIEVLSKPNFVLAIGLMSLLATAMGGGWLIIGLKIETALNPVVIQQAADHSLLTSHADRVRSLETLTASSNQSDAAGRIDRLQLNDRMHQLEDRLATGKAMRDTQIAITNSKLIEVETQFCASDIVRNLMHVSDLRYMAMLWHTTFPTMVLPTDNSYYPKICNRAGAEQ